VHTLPLLTRAGILGVLLACTACPGTLDDPARFTTDGGSGGGEGGDGGCPDIPTQVFAKVCSTSGCHTTADKIQGLDLQAPAVASRLVGVCARGGGLLIDLTHPMQSVIYEKVTIAPPFGARMPLGMPPLDDPTIACLLTWISQQQGSAGSCGDGGAPEAGMPEGGMPEAGGDSGGD
jgi:hypothetical protein